MHFSLAKNLNRKGTGSALGFAALAQTGIAIAVLLSLAFVSTGAARTPSVALILLACLLLANARLIASSPGLLDKYPHGGRPRFAQPAEVAELVLSPSQPGATAITGADLAIDLGLSAGK